MKVTLFVVQTEKNNSVLQISLVILAVLGTKGEKKEMRKKAKSLPFVFKELTVYINRQQVNI